MSKTKHNTSRVLFCLLEKYIFIEVMFVLLSLNSVDAILTSLMCITGLLFSAFDNH